MTWCYHVVKCFHGFLKNRRYEEYTAEEGWDTETARELNLENLFLLVKMLPYFNRNLCMKRTQDGVFQ